MGRGESNLEIHYAGEWAALYVDGKLEEVGDAYIAEERAFALLGVGDSEAASWAAEL